MRTARPCSAEGSGGALSGATGSINETMKVDPTRGSLSTVMEPPMSLTSSAQIERPSPEPPNRRVVVSSAWVNGSNIFAMASRLSPMPVSEMDINTWARSALG